MNEADSSASNDPSLAEDEIMTAAHYAAHIRVFPEGQMCVLDKDGLVVACSTDFMTKVDFDRFEHRYIDAVDGNWLGNHDPEGDWLYGADIGVLPAFRRQGIAKMLYAARQDLVRRLNLRGHVAGGMLSGFHHYKDRMPVEEYVEKVVAKEIFDPTLSVQLKRGFSVHGIIQNYVENALKNGLKHKLKDRRLTVNILEQNGFLNITIVRLNE